MISNKITFSLVDSPSIAFLVFPLIVFLFSFFSLFYFISVFPFYFFKFSLFTERKAIESLNCNAIVRRSNDLSFDDSGLSLRRGDLFSCTILTSTIYLIRKSIGTIFI